MNDGRIDLEVPPGARGQLVKDFQTCFNREIEEGRQDAEQIDVDGIFGPQTSKAVKHINSFQKVKDGVMRTDTFRGVSMPFSFVADFSDHQHTIDFKGLNSIGFDHAYYKLTEGFDYRSKKTDRLRDARDHMTLLGAYHFGRPDLHANREDAKKEAQNFLEMIEELEGKGVEFLLPHAYDFEKGDKNDEQHNVQYFETFTKELLNHKHWNNPAIYTARWAVDSLATSDLFRVIEDLNVQVWWAEYIREFPKGGPQKIPALMKDCRMWQMTAEFTCEHVKRWNGEAAKFDVNFSWDTKNVEKRYC